MRKSKVVISSPEKIIYPKDGITKMDVAKYYTLVAELMMPYVKNRRLSEIRCHGGIHGENFFKKHPTAGENVERIREGDDEYFCVKNAMQLIGQVQMGAVEFHTQSAREGKNPDVMIFDLDPDEELPLEALRKATMLIKSVLDGLSLTSYLKTSGGKGYHVAVPFKRSGGWDSFYAFAKKVALISEREWPNIFTATVKKSERKGKVFIDYMRNREGATCVAPYSLRARDGAAVSMPIEWNRLADVPPNGVTLKNFRKYISTAWDEFFYSNSSIK